MADIVSRSKIVDLRSRIEKEKEMHAANLNAANGAIQVIDAILAFAGEDEPAQKPTVKTKVR